MQIEHKGSNELVIIGNIKSIEDSLEIKAAIGVLQKKGVDSLLLSIKNSFSMTSTVIGFLMKTVNLDHISVSLAVGDQRLYDLLEDLSLLQPLKVRLVGK